MYLPRVLKYPRFKKLYFAGLTSELGSFVTETALMLAVFELSSNNKAFLGFARAIFLACLTLGNILGGYLGEKFNRRNILLMTNYLRIPVVLSLLFVQDVYLIIVADGLIALCTGIYNPTRQAVVNDIVPQSDINRANGLFGSTFAILHMLGPLLGAMLYSHFGGLKEILSFDLLTYFIGIYLIGTIVYTPPAKEEGHETKSFLHETYEGIKHVVKQRDLFAIITNASVAGLCIGFLFPLLLPFFTETLKMDGKAYGIALAFFGLGGFIGGWMSQKLSERYSPGKIIVWSLCAEPMFMFIWLNFLGFYQTCFIFLLWGIAVFIRMTSQLNYISDKVETRYLTRVFSLIDLAFVFPNIASGIIVSLIGNYFGTLEVLKTVSIFFIVLVFPRLFFKDMKILYNATRDKVQRDTSIQDSLAE